MIRELTEKKNSKFASYRTSKLTFMLKDSIGGNAKTTMLAAVRGWKPESAEVPKSEISPKPPESKEFTSGSIPNYPTTLIMTFSLERVLCAGPAQISPAASSGSETVSTLNFAASVKKVVLKPSVNLHTSNDEVVRRFRAPLEHSVNSRHID